MSGTRDADEPTEVEAAFREAMKHQGKTDDFSYNVREESSGNSRASKIEPVETDEIRVEPGSNGGYFIEAGRRRFRFPDVEDPVEVARLLLDIVEGDAEDRR